MEGEEGFLFKLDLFFINLEKKFEDWESYGEFSLDFGILVVYFIL